MPRTTDHRLYAVHLHLSYAEALQDVLIAAYAEANTRAVEARQRVLAAGNDSFSAERDYAFALKRVEALAELMKAVGQHI